MIQPSDLHEDLTEINPLLNLRIAHKIMDFTVEISWNLRIAQEIWEFCGFNEIWGFIMNKSEDLHEGNYWKVLEDRDYNWPQQNTDTLHSNK